MRGKLIVIEGTDCSGKETQTKRLQENLNNIGINTIIFSFPAYDTPTGKIIGGPYLGKSHIGECWFKEGAPAVDPLVASLYYAADRKYNINRIEDLLESGTNVILDRYVYSNMAHQGGKIDNSIERDKMYEWLENLEFKLLELPIPDIKIFLHMPLECAKILKKNRPEAPDGHERDENHLIHAENAYIEISQKYDFKTIECNKLDAIKTIDDISNEVFNYVKNVI